MSFYRSTFFILRYCHYPSALAQSLTQLLRIIYISQTLDLISRSALTELSYSPFIQENECNSVIIRILLNRCNDCVAGCGNITATYVRATMESCRPYARVLVVMKLSSQTWLQVNTMVQKLYTSSHLHQVRAVKLSYREDRDNRTICFLPLNLVSSVALFSLCHILSTLS